MKPATKGLLIISILIYGCCHKKATKVAGAEKSKKPVVSINNPVKPARPEGGEVIADVNADMTATGDMYQIDSLHIKADTLFILVNYSGGCKEHSFELISNMRYAKSKPPKISVSLKHTGNDDSCRELISRELKFNIKKLQYKGSSPVIIKLGEKQITYTGN